VAVGSSDLVVDALTSEHHVDLVWNHGSFTVYRSALMLTGKTITPVTGVPSNLQGSDGRVELRVRRYHVWSDGLERPDGQMSFESEPLCRMQRVLVDGT